MDNGATGEFIRIQTALAGRYFLERELGRGGMGIVYLARDVALDRLVAIKLLPPNLATDERLRARFLNEARTAAKLSHPNIIPIFSVEEIGDLVFFVMAYIDGETLGQRIRSRGPIPPTELGRLLREVAWGLAYAHGQGVIHRDIKADNILIERGSGRALVADFGIARVVERGGGGGTGIGEILGTAEYMSPEQASGEAVDHRSDIYSLGVVAFLGLSGRLPFEAPSVQALLAKQITQDAPRISDVADGVPRKLAKAVDRCLAKPPADRFAKAEELADAIGVALEARRDLPAPLRAFVKKSGDFGRTIIGVGVLEIFFGWSGIMFLRALQTLPLAREERVGMIAGMWACMVIGTLMAVPVVIGLVSLSRSLLSAGYTRAELNASWNAVREREGEERAFEHGRSASRVERFARRAALVSVPFAVAGFYWMTGDGTFETQGFWTYLISVSVMLIGAGVSLWRYDGRVDLGDRLMSKFWRSRLGKWLFALAGIGLERSAITASATHRPTELAIGMAVDALFDALPKSMREQLAELPETVRDLEMQVAKMRGRVEELTEAAAKLEPMKTGSAPAGKRDALAQDLEVARDAARQRMAMAVSALESIRLDLLRLTAGAGGIEGLTADLAAAREISDSVRHILEGRREVEMALQARLPGSEAPSTPRPR